MAEDVDLLSEVSVMLTESEHDIKTLEIDQNKIIVRLRDGRCFSLTAEEINGEGNE